jgi:outer membrane protein TolC
MQAKTARARSCEWLLSGALLLPLLVVTNRGAVAQAVAASQAQGPTQANAQPITLEQAVRFAEANDPAYAASVATHGSAKLDQAISRSTLLPAIRYYNQFLYTQGNGFQDPFTQIKALPVFIANNGVHEYLSQMLVNENLSLAGAADLARSGALDRKAGADLEIARRDLVVRVVAGYFGLIAADEKLGVARRAEGEANDFAGLARKLETGREVAHGDVVKADLGAQQRAREAADAQLAAEKARLDLGIFLFPDPRTEYTVAGGALPVLAPQAEIEAAAAARNPDLASALESARAAHDEVNAARAAYLPALSLNYTFGIDAPQFAVNGEAGIRNLGYSAFATLDIPIWDWFATHDRVKQSELRETAAKVALTSIQRQLIAELEEFYNEAKVAESQTASLDESVKTAQESLRLTKLRYSAGEATALEVVDAQNALVLTEAARADGSVRYRVALANLQTLTGTF